MADYMENNDSIRLVDIIKLLWKKAIWIALALVIGVVAGATYGYIKNTNNKVYGTELSFFVNPKTEGQTNNQIHGVYGDKPIADMIGWLSAPAFSEYLFLDENGLPAEGISVEIDEKIEAARLLLEDETATTEEKQEAVDAAVEAWQNTSDYNYWISLAQQSVQYSRGASTDKQAVAMSFINVKISVNNNEEFAKILREKIIEKLPLFVEDNMVVPTEMVNGVNKFVGTNCTRTSRIDEIVCTSDLSRFSTIVKNAILVGFATTAVACVVVLCLNLGTLTKKEAQETQE